MTAIFREEAKRPSWQTLVIAISAFWLSSSLLLDLVIMPTMYTTGMMNQVGFATTGYSIFWVFNRIELVCAALILTSILMMRSRRRDPFAVIVSGSKSRWALALAGLLAGVAIIYTYVLAPEMSALGIELDLFEPAAQVPAAMDQMHEAYWGLEAIKVMAVGALLSLFYRDATAKI